MNEIKEEKTIPLMWQEAFATLIYKEGSGAMLLPQSYRPISKTMYTKFNAHQPNRLCTKMIHERYYTIHNRCNGICE